MTISLLLGLFASAFLSATILPGSSEVVALGLMTQGIDVVTIWTVATVGNVIGSVLNWWIGLQALRFKDRKWFPVRPEQLAKVQGWYARWGKPTLLLSWIPGFGDAFTVAAGVLKVPLLTFLVLVTIAKGGRYAALIGVAEGAGFSSWFS